MGNEECVFVSVSNQVGINKVDFVTNYQLLSHSTRPVVACVFFNFTPPFYFNPPKVIYIQFMFTPGNMREKNTSLVQLYLCPGVSESYVLIQ